MNLLKRFLSWLTSPTIEGEYADDVIIKCPCDCDCRKPKAQSLEFYTNVDGGPSDTVMKLYEEPVASVFVTEPILAPAETPKKKERKERKPRAKKVDAAPKKTVKKVDTPPVEKKPTKRAKKQ